MLIDSRSNRSAYYLNNLFWELRISTYLTMVLIMNDYVEQ